MLIPSKELYEIAIDCEEEVYQKNIDLGTTEFKISKQMLCVNEKAEWIKVLAIAGSNEKITRKNLWNFIKEWGKNFDLRSLGGIKKAGVDAMVEILSSKEFRYQKNDKLLIVVHSKSGPTGTAFANRYRGNDNVYVVEFAPAPAMRRRGIDRVFPNMTIFIDPDDIVHQLGIISFGQPICQIFKLPNDHIGKNLKDHGLKNFRKFIEGMPNE